MASFRHTTAQEDEVLARILYNAFHDAWEMNWWQNLKGPVGRISIQPTEKPLPEFQSARLNFYLAFLMVVRTIGGSVAVVTPADSEQPAAVCCWLPPNVRPTIWETVRAGFLIVMFRFGGIRGLYRLWSYERLNENLFDKCLSSFPYSRREGAFVQILGTDPTQSGNRYSEQLLRWQIEQHEQQFPNTPIFIDTNTDYAERIYERLGFVELGREVVSANVDANGFQLEHAIDEDLAKEIDSGHVTRVLIYECKSSRQ